MDLFELLFRIVPMLVISFSVNSFAYTQDQINHYTAIALSMDLNRIEKPGNYVCETELSDQTKIQASHDDLEKARALYVFKCVRQACDQLSETVKKGIKDLKDLNPSILTAYLKTLGLEPRQIEQILNNLTVDSVITLKASCVNTTDISRRLIFDLCSMQLIRCFRK